MAKSIALSHSMDVFIITDGTTATELSLGGNGVKVEMNNEELQVTSATSTPSSGNIDAYTTVDAQYTVVFNGANTTLGILGLEDIDNLKIIKGGTYDLKNGASFNIRRLGNNIVVSEY